jgi:RHS repeat-associated protein
VVGVDNSPFEGITVELYKDGVLQTNDDLTGENGAVLFTLNDGVYQFAANLSETRFWSETCTMPGCLEQEIVLPGGQGGIQETTISYEYDDLYRLTEANYDNGLYFHYSYDAAGNRLMETTQSSSTSYVYDVANRLSNVDGVPYTWDNNGNLLSDGTSTYSYDYNNKLVGLTQGTDVYQYVYNGLGDRVQQIVDGVTTNYVLDINTGLTQVLQDGTNTYLYGVNRVAQSTPTETEYFLADALGSVRNLTDGIGNITLTQSYSPFGEVLNTSGDGQTDYAFTGEMFDPETGLVYLRARYYGVDDGRFVSRDSWVGDNQIPISYNSWLYVNSNPINLIDALGLYPTCEGEGCYEPLSDSELLKLFGVGLLKEWNPENIYALSIAIDMVARKLLEKSGLSDNKYKVFREVYGITPSKHMSFTWDPKCYNCRKSQCMAFVNDLEKEFWATEYTIDENGKEEYLLIPVNGENLPCTCTPQGAYTHGPKTYEFASMWSNVYNQTLLRNVNNVIHELGHGFNSRIDSIPANALAGYVVNIKGKDYPLVQKDRGFYKYPPEKIYVQNIAPNGSETFADMYLGWVSNVWAFNPYGDARRDFMESNMTSWIHIAMNR